MKTPKGSRDSTADWARSHSSWVILIVTILLAAVLYGIVFWYQAGRPNREGSEQSWPAANGVPCLIAGSAYTVELSLTYPQRLLNEPTAPDRPLSVRLRARTAPSADEGLGGWTVVFSPPDRGILFTDQEGTEIAPRLVITPGVESAAVGVLHVRRSALSTAPDVLTLTMHLYEPASSSPLWSVDLPAVELESDAAARLRRCLDMGCGPTTPLLVLAAGLVTFGVREWQERRKRERERDKEAKLAQIEALRDLRHDVIQAAREYKGFQRRIREEPGWQDDDLRKRLEEVWKDLFRPRELQDSAVEAWCEGKQEDAALLADLIGERGSLSEALRTLFLFREQASGEEIAQACLTVYGEYAYHDKVGGRVRQAVAEKLAGLLNKGTVSLAAIEPQIEKYTYVRRLLEEPALKGAVEGKIASSNQEEREVARRLLDTGSKIPPWWLGFWRAEREQDAPAVAAWCQRAGLRFNPFGPAEAELDPLLPAYWVDTFSQQTQGKRATLVWGAPGSGQTAAAMLLAYRCIYPPSSPYEAGAFPVYWNPFDRATARAARSLEEGLLKATAATLARYLASHPAHFTALQEGRKERIARLLTFWAGSPEQLKQTWHAEDPDSSVPEDLRRDVVQHCPEHVPDGTMGLLSGAWPREFGSLYLILDASAFPTPNLPRAEGETTTELPPPQLRRELEKLCPTIEDVKTLCSDLGIGYDDLAGSERRSKIRELVLACERQERLSDLVRWMREQGSRAFPAPIEDLQSLFGMVTQLAGQGVYLKLFLPLALQPHLSLESLSDRASSLTWSESDLKNMLQARLRAAGKGDILALCAPDVPSDLDDRLVRAAGGSPRRLIQFGNRLLEAQARRLDPRSLLCAEVVDSIVGPVRCEEGV